ncbi:MAG: DUF3140 domain-containing protein [Janthinobacterium lividum]
MATKIFADALYRTSPENVNMMVFKLERWLKTHESKSVGQADNGGKSIGYQSSQHIISILHKKRSDLGPAEEIYMHKMPSYIARPLAQRPGCDVAYTSRHRSLMS